MASYVIPGFQGEKFTCPLCGTLSSQVWWSITLSTGGRPNQSLDNYQMCQCVSCNDISLWHSAGWDQPTNSWSTRQVWPVEGGPPPHDDMPPAARHHYEQARAVLGAAPQAAAALLRVATEALVHHLLRSDGVMLNEGIKQLVAAQRIGPDVARACDVLRVTGNDMLHPGQIDPDDDRSEVAERLFGLVNFIVQRAITEPAEIAALYAELPETKREAIEKRDAPPV